MKKRLVLVGGFLGAGKTTLLNLAAEKLKERGLKVGLITNDQAPELVDTRLLASSGKSVSEVSGSCFCCNFPGLAKAMESFGDVDVVLAEPVGSCTDLSATIAQPLKDEMGNQWVIAPLTVLVEAGRLSDVRSHKPDLLHLSAGYIFDKQVEEADIVALSKADTLSEDGLAAATSALNSVGKAPIILSSANGEGIDLWLDQVLAEQGGGRKIVDVDYDIYAEGEAVLGWLNSTYELSGSCADWQSFAKDLVDCINGELGQAPIGHLKILLEGEGGVLTANLTSAQSSAFLRGDELKGDVIRLTINARIESAPDDLAAGVARALDRTLPAGLRAVKTAAHCLSPGRPTPTHRYSRVIEVG